MNIFKKTVVGLMAFAAVVAYPLVSTGKTDSKADKITLNKNNTVILNGEIDDASAATTIKSLMELDSGTFGKKKPIYLFVYSPGGSIQAGLELIEAAKGLDRQVDTITMFAASMAFQTVQNLGERLILKNGVLMSHRAAGGFEGNFGGQFPSQIDSRYSFWLHRLQELDEKTVERTNGKQTLQTYQDAYKNEAWWTGSQSLQFGYADRIVTLKCDDSLSGTDVHHVSFMGIPVQYETSKCPLITAPMNVKIEEQAKKMVTDENAEQIKKKFLESRDLEKNVR